MNKLLIVDGFNLLWRAYFGFPTRIKNKSGFDITAPFGFFALLRADAIKIGPELRIIVCFDGQLGSDEKRKALPEYKSNRPDDGPEVLHYLTQVKDGLDRIGVPWLEFQDTEADQLIASLAAHFSPENEVIILSNDKDFYQLLDEKITIWNGSGQKIIDADDLREKFGILPFQWPEFVSLVGDKSDNISGISGIGKVKASRLLSEFGSIMDIIDDQAINSEVLSAIRREKERFMMNIEIVELSAHSNRTFNVRASPLKTHEIETAGLVMNMIGLG